MTLTKITTWKDRNCPRCEEAAHLRVKPVLVGPEARQAEGDPASTLHEYTCQVCCSRYWEGERHGKLFINCPVCGHETTELLDIPNWGICCENCAAFYEFCPYCGADLVDHEDQIKEIDQLLHPKCPACGANL